MKTKKQLIKLKDHGKSKKERIRAEAILLSMRGYKKVKIADILGVTQRSVFGWFKEYKEKGISSLNRAKGQGRKNLLNKKDHSKIIEKYINENPNQPKKAYSLTVEALNKEFSYSTFKRFLKKHLI